MDLVQHLKRQKAFSRATFGPGPRTKGVVDHIRKELVEIEESEPGTADHSKEWVDVAILALDGLWRALEKEGFQWNQIAGVAAQRIELKQDVNEERDWPDWRKMSEDQAIEHKRENDADI